MADKHLISSKQIDPFYYQLQVDTDADPVIDALAADIVQRFKNRGYRTLLVKQKQEGHFLVSCVAIRLQEGKSFIVSQDKDISSLFMQDGSGMSVREAAAIDPSQVQFGSGAKPIPSAVPGIRRLRS